MSGSREPRLSARQTEKVSARARAALALAAAERCLPELQTHSAAHECGRQALHDAWQWETGESVSSRKLYEHIRNLMVFEEPLTGDAHRSAALLALVSALYYTTWLADRTARLSDPTLPPLPNDIAEVDEDDLSATLDYAVQAHFDEPSERAWQKTAIQKLVTLQGDQHAFGIGSVPRGFFRGLRTE